MNLVFIGPPGAGKGTQAERVCEKYSIPHISTGALLREEIKQKTQLGEKAQEFIHKGELLPDELMISMLRQRISDPDCEKGFLLDGFPRTMEQAKSLREIAKIDCVINLDADPKKLAKRMSGRRVCQDCGATYHVDASGYTEQCIKCGSKLVQRKDDQEQVVVNRLEVYEKQTLPLTQYYQSKNELITIDAQNDVETIFNEICLKLEQL